VKTASYWTITWILLALFGSRMVQQGLFIDGLWYAAIAHNMAQGIGTLWAPHFSATCEPIFYGHPPLAFWLQSVTYKVFGSAFWTDQVYSLLLMVATIALMRIVWRRLMVERPELQPYWIVSVLVWLLNEEVSLRYTSNMLECTVALAALAAVAAMLRWGYTWRGIVLGGLGIVAACLSKGPVGLFPLAFYAIWHLSKPASERTSFVRQVVVPTAALSGVLAVFGAILWSYGPSHAFLKVYFDVQIRTALAGESIHNVAPHRLYIVQRWFETFAPALVVTCGVFFWTLKYRTPRAPLTDWLPAPAWRLMILTGGIGLSALLPIMVSSKQAAHYIVPSLPWFGLAFGGVLAPILHFNVKKQHLTVPRYAVPLLIAACVATMGWLATRWGTPRDQDRAFLTDVRAIMSVVPDHSTVTFRRDWFDGRAYSTWQRYHAVTLDEAHYHHRYLVRERAFELPDTLMQQYRLVPLATTIYDLYERRTESKSDR
jgi:4-amino-4-deoxy-L-arabinose transferase-like glycosyltransferase